MLGKNKDKSTRMKISNHMEEIMTNTYSEDSRDEYKISEELRLIRCLMERMLRLQSESLFVDYQMEKFGKDYKS
jgi:hypothetical protein